MTDSGPDEDVVTEPDAACGIGTAEATLRTVNTIRGLALPCDFPLPEASSEGMDVDPRLVN